MTLYDVFEKLCYDTYGQIGLTWTTEQFWWGYTSGRCNNCGRPLNIFEIDKKGILMVGCDDCEWCGSLMLPPDLVPAHETP